MATSKRKPERDGSGSRGVDQAEQTYHREDSFVPVSVQATLVDEGASLLELSFRQAAAGSLRFDEAVVDISEEVGEVTKTSAILLPLPSRLPNCSACSRGMANERAPEHFRRRPQIDRRCQASYPIESEVNLRRWHRRPRRGGVHRQRQ